MKRGTKSILFGVHQFILHPLFVLRAWFIIYRSFPTLSEFMAILTHDLGYWGKADMDGTEGSSHPASAAAFWRGRFGGFGNEVADIIIGHSRFHAATNGLQLSKLFRPDKLSTALYPRWLYLLLGNLSGEIKEYMRHHSKGLYTGIAGKRQTQTQWLIETQGHVALMGIQGENYHIVADQMKETSTRAGCMMKEVPKINQKGNNDKKTKNGFYRKYLLSRTDGKPLKGQEYFILRLDSKDPVEREAVRKGLSAYGEIIKKKSPELAKTIKAFYEHTKQGE